MGYVEIVYTYILQLNNSPYNVLIGTLLLSLTPPTPSPKNKFIHSAKHYTSRKMWYITYAAETHNFSFPPLP